jgi:hypothetical protein
MTSAQASQLGKALIAWSQGMVVEVRDCSLVENRWVSFDPSSYEKLNVDDDLDWRINGKSPSLAICAIGL